MKKIIIVFILCLGVVFYSKAQNAENPIDKVIKMSKEEYDLGKIKHNESTTFFIEFTNISKKPVVVENVTVSCGCTVAEKPSAPITPGSTGKIKVGYNGSNSPGSKFVKTVFVKIAGVNDPKTVTFTGETVD